LKKFSPWLLSVLTGILGFLGYIGYNQFYLEWFFLVPLLWATRNQSPGRAFFLGWIAGTVGHSGGFYWFVHMLTVFAGMNLFFSILGLVFFAAFNGLTFAIFAWATCRLKHQKKWSVWWTAPFIWTTLENFFPFIFPNYIGASQYPILPLTQIADITGILGISFLLIWCNSTCYIVMENLIERRKFPIKEASIFIIIIGMTAIYGMIRISQIDAAIAIAHKKKVVIVQAGQGGADKHQDPWTFFKLHQKLTQQVESKEPPENADLIIWPESVITVPLSRKMKQLPWDLFGQINTPLLFGTITAERKKNTIKKFTSAMLVDKKSRVMGIYDKQILIPFGEYIPFGDIFPSLYEWSPYISHFFPGSSLAPITFGNYIFSLNICYEDLFADLVRQNMCAQVSSGKPLPHAIVNLTNDSWYGDTTEPLEHLVLASFRAIEHRRALVRSTNTGISAIIDPVGRLQKKTGQWTQEILVGDVPMMTGRTWYSHAGNWFGWTASVLTIFFVCLSFMSIKKRGKTKKNKHEKSKTGNENRGSRIP
jgi:apolipoprotein N-acyltransferase